MTDLCGMCGRLEADLVHQPVLTKDEPRRETHAFVQLTDEQRQIRNLTSALAHVYEGRNKAEKERDEARAALAGMRAALEKINAIRNSIVGTETVNWSAHVYPLVEALNEAGFVGETYEVARAKAQTLIEQRDTAIAERDALKAERDSLHGAYQNNLSNAVRLQDERDLLRKALEKVWAAIGDRLLAQGPISDEYWQAVAGKVLEALEASR